nr:hypothetical protein GCM10017611_04180 [Rhodococcus wratislaviensis]
MFVALPENFTNGTNIMLNGPAQVLPYAASRFADKTALVTHDRTMTFAELDAASSRVAGALHSRGVEPGQTVSLYSQNRWEWLVAYHGALKTGAVVNPINVMLTTDEVEYVLRDARSAAVFVGADQAGTLVEATARIPQQCDVIVFGSTAVPGTVGLEVPGTVAFRTLVDTPADSVQHRPRLDDTCTIGYTSGTTGHPKGAVQSNRAVIANFGLTATMHGRTDADVVVTALPAPHVYGNVAINSTWLAGGTVVLMERFDPAAALAWIGEHRATMFEGVPAMYAAMLSHPALDNADLSSLTRSTVGGQTMPEATIERWEERSDAPLIELWGHDRTGRAGHDTSPTRSGAERLDRRPPPRNGGAAGRPARSDAGRRGRRGRRAADTWPRRHEELLRERGSYPRGPRQVRMATDRGRRAT